MAIPHFTIGSNSVWLTLSSTPNDLLIQTYVLGLGADRSLLCALPENQNLKFLISGTLCKGRSYIDGEIFEFETTIQGILSLPAAIQLAAPQKIARKTPRSFPRLTVNFTGIVRPLSNKSHILAVVPVRIRNLSPTGCQLHTASFAWPTVPSLPLLISFRLPGFHYHSKFSGSTEWVHSGKEIVMGIKFLFSSPQDAPCQDVTQWYRSQRSHLIDTTV